MGNNASSKHLTPTAPPWPVYFDTDPVWMDLNVYLQPRDTQPEKKHSRIWSSLVKSKRSKKNEKMTELYDNAFNNAAFKPPPRGLTDYNFQPYGGQRFDYSHFDLIPPLPPFSDTLTNDHGDFPPLYDSSFDSVRPSEDEMDAYEREDPPLRNSQILVPEQVEKRYDPLDMTLKFVTREDDIDPLSSEDGDSSLRAEMSCGHAVTPESLTQWCLSLLHQGKFKFRCPAVVEGTKQCNKQWSYQEVRRLADLSVGEMEYFESTVARLAASQYCDIKPCPQCRTSVERMDTSNLCVRCPICTADQKTVYQFCWLCLREWTGSSIQGNCCKNDGCFNKDLQLLQTCKNTGLPEVQGAIDCPSIRACPTCGVIIEHSRDKCKNIYCPRCHVEFCFMCLKLTRECSKTSSPFQMCMGGVAPRQTAIPVWKRN